MKSRLHEPHAGEAALGRALQDSAPQPSSHTSVLSEGINCDWTDARDSGPLVHAIAAYDSPVPPSDNAEESGVSKHHGNRLFRYVGRGEIGWKVVVFTKLGESVVADSPAKFDVR